MTPRAKGAIVGATLSSAAVVGTWVVAWAWYTALGVANQINLGPIPALPSVPPPWWICFPWSQFYLTYRNPGVSEPSHTALIAGRAIGPAVVGAGALFGAFVVPVLREAFPHTKGAPK